MHRRFWSRSRARRLTNRYGASSLSHSTRHGSPRTRCPATSAISAEYAASTASCGVSYAGSWLSGMKTLIGACGVGLGQVKGNESGVRAIGMGLSRPMPPPLHFHLDRQVAGLVVLGDLLDGAELLGLLLERLAGDLVDHLAEFGLEFFQAALQLLGGLGLEPFGLPLGPALQVLLELLPDPVAEAPLAGADVVVAGRVPLRLQ